MEKVDCIIVGGGLAGLSAAYGLASEGVEVLVIERGDYSGAKNVTGVVPALNNQYLNPFRGQAVGGRKSGQPSSYTNAINLLHNTRPLFLERVGDFAPQIPGDNPTHDVQSTLCTHFVRHHAAEHHLQGGLLGETERTVIHHAVTGCFVRQGRGQALAGGDDFVYVLVREGAGFLTLSPDHPGSSLEIELEHIQLHPVIDHLKRDALILDERFPKGSTLGIVLRADFQSSLRSTEARCRNQHTSGVEAFHHMIEPAVLLTQETVFGDLHVLVDPTAGGQTHTTHVLIDGPGNAVQVGRNVHEGKTFVRLLWISHHQRTVATGRTKFHTFLGSRDIGLLAVKDVLVTILQGGRLDAGQVRPATGSVVLIPTNASPLAAAVKTSSFNWSVPNLLTMYDHPIVKSASVSYTHLRAHETDSYLVC